MYGTYLDGAIFNEAELQGVDFRPQSLRSTSFQNVMVWRATAQAPFQQDMITGLITSATRTCTPQELHSGKQVCNWSAEDYNSLRTGLEDGASGNALVPSALNRIERLDPRINMDRDGQSAERWAAQERTSPARDAYEKTLAEQWASTGCKAEGAPYVIRALVDRLNTEFASPSPHPAALAATFLDDKRCPGARGF